MNHKRRQPKSRRAGCLMCKPHKHERANGSPKRLPVRDRRRAQEQE